MSQKLAIVRGTSDILTVVLTADEQGTPYKLGENEKLIFGMKRSPAAKDYVIHKALTAAEALKGADGVYVFNFKPADTIDLYGEKYFYGIAIESGDDLYPIIPCAEFSVTDCVPEMEGK